MDKYKQTSIKRKQLDAKLTPLRQVMPDRPRGGWIRDIRRALRMTTGQLAQRLELAQSTIPNMEKAEAQGSVTVRTLREAAAALDCKFVYAFIPNESLEATVRKQALKKAMTLSQKTNITMSLESQGNDEETRRHALDDLVQEVLWKQGHKLWEEE